MRVQERARATAPVASAREKRDSETCFEIDRFGRLRQRHRSRGCSWPELAVPEHDRLVERGFHILAADDRGLDGVLQPLVEPLETRHAGNVERAYDVHSFGADRARLFIRYVVGAQVLVS